MKLKNLAGLAFTLSVLITGCTGSGQPGTALPPGGIQQHPEYAPSRTFPDRASYEAYYSFFSIDTNLDNFIDLGEFISARRNILFTDTALNIAREEFIQFDINFDNNLDQFEHQTWLDASYY